MSHTTKYGNKYTAAEWLEMSTEFKAEEDRASDIDRKVEKMLNYLKRQCKEYGFDDNQANTITRLFKDGSFVEANIKFSSEENETFINKMYSRFDTAMRKL